MANDNYTKECLTKTFNAIFSAFDYAVEKHPDWSEYGLSRMMLILAEECGEAVKAANDLMEAVDSGKLGGDESDTAVIAQFVSEVAQTGAMAARILAEMNKRGEEVMRHGLQ